MPVISIGSTVRSLIRPGRLHGRTWYVLFRNNKVCALNPLTYRRRYVTQNPKHSLLKTTNKTRKSQTERPIRDRSPQPRHSLRPHSAHPRDPLVVGHLAMI